MADGFLDQAQQLLAEIEEYSGARLGGTSGRPEPASDRRDED
jgi:hypothetical protein